MTSDLSRLASSAGRSQTQKRSTQVELVGSPVLVDPPTLVAEMVERPADREAGDGRELASRQFSVVLAIAFPP